MGGDHSHGTSVPSSPGTVRAVLAVIVPLALVTLAALIWMWPDASEPAGGASTQVTRIKGVITDIDLKPCPKAAARPDDWLSEPGAAAAPPTDPAKCGDARIQLNSGDHVGQVVTVQLPSGPGTQVFAEGDAVVVIQMAGITDGSAYQLSDHDRTGPLWAIAAAFAVAVIAFGRLRGLTALVGLAVTFVLLLKFLIPAIIAGQPPLLVAIVCAAAIMLAVLYLTHGFTVATSIAVIGTLASLTLTGLLATAAIKLAHLNGITDDNSLNLDLSGEINTRGLLLASIIIGSLGVLDDVTVTQSVTVTELAHADPAAGFRKLYRAGSRIGRAHIASVINTIVLAYAGAALPLLLLLTMGSQALGDTLTGPILAQEIARSVAGTLGLIAAVPITTALAALARTRRPAPDHEHSAKPARPPSRTGASARPDPESAETPQWYAPPGERTRPRRPADPF